MDRTGRRLWIAGLAIAIPGLMLWATRGTGDTPDFEIPPTQYVTQTVAEDAAGDSGVVNADETAVVGGDVEQVVGKQLGRYQLPKTGRSAPQASKRTSSGGGFFSGLFGRSSGETKSVPTRTGELQGGNDDVNWDGVPYHDVSGKKTARTKAQPIRSQSTQSRVASRLQTSRLQTKGGATASIPTPPPVGGASTGPKVYRNSNARLSVPKPPAETLATQTKAKPAPASSRSVNPSNASNKTTFSSVTSSRRNGRELVANASSSTESARPDYSNVPDLVPRVSRKTIEKSTQSKTDAAKKLAAKPAQAKPNVSKTKINKPEPKTEKVAAAPVEAPAKKVEAPAKKLVKKEAATPVTEPKPKAIAKAAPAVAPSTTAVLSKPTAIEKQKPTPEQFVRQTPAPHTPASLSGSAAIAIPPAATPSAGSQPTNPYPHLGYVAAGNTPPAATPAPPLPFGNDGFASRPSDGHANFQTASSPIGSGIAGRPQPYGPSQPYGQAQPYGPNQGNYGPHVGYGPHDQYASRDAFAGQSQYPHPTLQTRGTVAAAPPENRIAENPNADDHSADRTMVADTGRGITPATPEMTPIAGYQARETLRSEQDSRSFDTDARANQMRASANVEPVAPGRHSVTSELPGIRVVTYGPETMMIRQTKEYEIRVENRGSIDAEGVVVRAMIPDWAELRGDSTTRGEVEKQANDLGEKIVWTLDHLPAGQSEKLFVKLTAARSGNYELDVDWTLLPRKAVSHVLVHEPKLNLTIEGPDEVVYGESETYKVRVLNPGDGVAPNVVFILSPDSTPQTQRIGDIPPGKEAQFDVELTAQDLADLKIHGLATGDLDLRTEATKVIRVSAANLEAVLTGPETKYQNTEAMYALQLQNLGTATSENITASLRLPSGCEYLGGIEGATQRGNLVKWDISKLSPKGKLDYEFRCNLTATGEQMFAFRRQGIRRWPNQRRDCHCR